MANTTEDTGTIWYDDRNELTAFAEVLVATSDMNEVEDLLYYLDKPWKWSKDHAIWETYGSPMPDGKGWDNYENSLTEEVSNE